MNVVLLGPPGAGKGTQGAIISQQHGIPRIATGDLLRDAVKAGSPLGMRSKAYMDQGKLVPDDIILGLIEEKLESREAQHGVIMDGFPRTIAQAKAVDRLLSSRGARVEYVLAFDVAEEELVRRMAGRAGTEGRSDDTPETIRRRLDVFRKTTEPLIAYYRQRDIVTHVEATGSIDQIAARVEEVLAA
jgi:adenylate kinase